MHPIVVTALPVAMVSLLLLADAPASEVPQQLACLARHYPLQPAFHGGAWFGVLADGTRLPLGGDANKTFEQRLEAPDLADIFFVRYLPGPIAAVDAENHDPGRFRSLDLLAATYGRHPASEQVRERFLGIPVRVHRKITAPLARVAARLADALARDPTLRPFLQRLSGGFADRNIAGTHRRSAHAFGIAIDLDKSMSDYWRWQPQGQRHWRNRIPQAVVDAFEAEGFIWGGRWYHYDTMHFEYRPEMLDPGCW